MNQTKKCIDCEKIYCDYKNDKTKRKCRICKCSEHGSLKEVHYATSKGDTWLCEECLQLTNIVERKHPNLFENLRKTLIRKYTKIKKTKSNQNKTLVSKETGDKQNKKTISFLDIVFKDEDVQ
ncbi:unnamed protein product, partial [Meganyctiphanes norvegica]|uniref:Uncharacterized protein n=1 Tax=Meganyctiphanes norvegica TaxID=48144 RepID=A0AAV2PR84_MEGNR